MKQRPAVSFSDEFLTVTVEGVEQAIPRRLATIDGVQFLELVRLLGVEPTILLLTLGVLAHRKDGKVGVRVTQDELATVLGIKSRNTVKKYLKVLEDEGFLEVVTNTAKRVADRVYFLTNKVEHLSELQDGELSQVRGRVNDLTTRFLSDQTLTPQKTSTGTPVDNTVDNDKTAGQGRGQKVTAQNAAPFDFDDDLSIKDPETEKRITNLTQIGFKGARKFVSQHEGQHIDQALAYVHAYRNKIQNPAAYIRKLLEDPESIPAATTQATPKTTAAKPLPRFPQRETPTEINSSFDVTQIEDSVGEAISQELKKQAEQNVTQFGEGFFKNSQVTDRLIHAEYVRLLKERNNLGEIDQAIKETANLNFDDPLSGSELADDIRGDLHNHISPPTPQASQEGGVA